MKASVLRLTVAAVVVCFHGSCGAPEETARESDTVDGAAEILNGTTSNNNQTVGIQTTYTDQVTGATAVGTCTGTPIGCSASKTVILTAAHCIPLVRINPFTGAQLVRTQVQVTADSTVATGLVSATVVNSHPGYFGVSPLDINDIAILVVPSKMAVTCVEVNREVLRPERLSQVSIAGYGVNQDVPLGLPASGSGVRRSAPGTFRAALTYHYQAANGNAVGNTQRQCQGDSGGPTFATIGGVTKVLGTVSYGRNASAPQTSCGDDFNGSFNVRADMHVDFIDSNLEREGFLTKNVFSDVEMHPARDEITWMTRAGNISGFPGGTFRPDDLVTRGQFAAILAQTFLRDAPLADALPKDVPTNYFAAQAIRRVVKAGMMRGFPDGTFGPEKQVLRQDVLVALVNGLSIPSRANSSAMALAQAFIDTDDISSYARPAVANAFGWDMLRNTALLARRSMSGNAIRPLAPATRAEVASFIWWARTGAQTTPGTDVDVDGVPDKNDFCEFVPGGSTNGC
jgi:S-layer homology domain/Trypsin